MLPELTSVITSEAQIRDILGTPTPIVATKAIPIIDSHCATIISRSPFLLISSADANGNMDISPKGDPPGFVKILDEKHLAIPDRPGNRRADTLRNIIAHPNIALLFLVPGMPETLRVNGTARVVTDQWLLDDLALKGKPAQLAIVVRVNEAFLHCARCITQAALWDAGTWQLENDLPPLMEMVKEHSKLHHALADSTAD